MKVNLPVFKDEDAKDAVTYQSWRWDLMVYQCAGCRDCSLLPYAIRSLQGYPGELVSELWYAYNLGQHVDNPGQTLQQRESIRHTEPRAIPTTDGR